MEFELDEEGLMFDHESSNPSLLRRAERPQPRLGRMDFRIPEEEGRGASRPIAAR